MRSEYIKLRDKCEELWKEVIKMRAGYKSEISGRQGKQIGGSFSIAAHHIYGKSTLLLRFSLENGICLDNAGEHNYGIHNPNPVRSDEIREKIISVKGIMNGGNIYDRMRPLKNKIMTKKNGKEFIRDKITEFEKILKEEQNG